MIESQDIGVVSTEPVSVTNQSNEKSSHEEKIISDPSSSLLPIKQLADSDTDSTISVNKQIEKLVLQKKTKENGRIFSAEEELGIAINYCLDKLRELGDLEDGNIKKELMAKLVECRLKLEKLKESDVNGELLHLREYQNHEFVIQSARGRNPYCEVCMSTIWRLIQRWRKCRTCGFRVHDKCIDGVIRNCAGAEASSPDFCIQTRICPEQGLDAQEYACAECKRPLQFGGYPDLEPRLCDYNGLYYCSHCHWNDEWMIPARVLCNWDCNKYKICRASKQLLACIDRKPLYNFSQLNPRLLKFVAQLTKIKKLRRDIMFMKCYFVCCKEARRLRILQYLNRRQHFVESAEWYSLADLRDLVEGRLLPEIEQIVSVFTEHITRDCLICQGNGFICELCRDDKVIYLFSDGVAICHSCCAVFHKQCFDISSKRCPRCVRRKQRLPYQISGEEPPSEEGYKIEV